MNAQSPEKSGKIAVIVHETVRYSETFVANHIRHLNAEVFYVGEYPRPLFLHDYSGSVRGLLRLAYHFFLNQFRILRMSRKYKQLGITCSIAEYGTVAALVYPFFRSGRKLIVEFRGYDAYNRDFVDKLERQYRELIPVTAGIVVKSRHMRQRLIDLGASPDKIEHIVSGVSTEDFLGVIPDYESKHILALGRFVEKKAPYLTILAFAAVLQEEPNARLTMGGDGVLLGVCERIVEGLGLSDAVDFAGITDRARIKELMSRSVCFVQHSLTASNGDSEGTPNSIIEAGCAGLPVVSTYHAGISDVIEHGQNGFLVEEGDVAGMAEYMLRLVRDPELAREVGLENRARVHVKYDVSTSIQKLRNFIQTGVPSVVSDVPERDTDSIVPLPASAVRESTTEESAVARLPGE